MAKVEEWAVSMQRVVQVRDKPYIAKERYFIEQRNPHYEQSRTSFKDSRIASYRRFNALGNEIRP